MLAFKYGSLPGLVRPLGEALLERAGERLARLQPVMIPVPLHRLRRRRRGFDACDTLARLLGRRLGLNVARALDRPRGTTPQTGLGLTARRRNTAGAFRVLRPEALLGRNAVLIDDVLTTGSTVGACARLLLGAGAREVGVLTLARARPGAS